MFERVLIPGGALQPGSPRCSAIFFDFTGVVNKSDYFHLRAAFFANQRVDLVDFLDPNTPLAGDGLFINACRINGHSIRRIVDVL